MIEIHVDSLEDGFMNIRVDGHADSDICRAVSAILQTNVRVLQEIAIQFPEQVKVTVKEE